MPSKINPNQFDDGQPVSKSALRDTLSTIKDEVEQRGYATIIAGTPDPDAVLQAADDEGLIAKIIGPLNLPDGLHLRTGGLQGNAGQHNSQHAVTLQKPMVIGRAIDEQGNAGPRVSNYGHLRDLSLRVGDPSQPVVTNNEAHWQIIDNVSIRGNSAPGVPKLRLNATLYNRITNCDFGDTAGAGDGIHAKQSDFPITYYGLNGSWIDRCNFNIKGVAAWLHGIFSFRDSTIENGSSIAPKLIIGETGGAVSAKTVVDHVYFETKTVSTESQVYPCIELQSDSSPTITNCIFNHNNSSHSDAANAVTISMSGHQSLCSIRNNFFNLGNNSDAVAINAVLTNTGYHEYVNNQWSSTQDYKIKVDGLDINNKKEQPATIWRRKVYVRDRKHGEIRQCIPQRDIWLNYVNDQAGAIKAEGGRNHVIRAVPAGDITVSDRTNWVGARLTVHFGVAGCVLKHGNDFFHLASGEDTAIPQHTVLDFVIDRSGVVREVGAATLAFKLAAATSSAGGL